MAKKILGFFNKQKQFEQNIMDGGMQYSSFYGDSLRRLKRNKMAMFCVRTACTDCNFCTTYRTI